MRRKLDRYIGKQVLLSILVVMVIVVGLDFTFRVIEELPELNERYTTLIMLGYAGLNMPAAFYEFLPLGCLVGCLIGLGGLASGSELTVMRAAGISVWQLVRMVLKPVIVLSLLALVVGEYIAPYAGALSESIRAHHLNRGTVSARAGVWHRESGEYIHINVVTPDGETRGITRFGLAPDSSLSYSSYAKSGRYQNGAWVLEDVTETRFIEDRTQTTVYDTQAWEIELNPQRLKVLMVKPKEMSTSELYNYSQYLEEQELDNDRFMQSFWRKAFQPLAIIGLVLVAVSFIFGSLRSVSTGQRIITGVVVGMVFKISQDILAPLSSLYQVAPVWSALVPILICMLLGGWLIKRAG
ncbi:LPS export ABC transporter permease LptG [Amphritea japonica]|uniref:Lipopolysaccharide export system permease protein n=1 Tax=Amphritea japonica ATCC BAA-1530 TaxID=1278309 RepID=A0A7R6P7N2_9GAMM|nr:LPS export ABC transporter permease LptG [Amphritea japonica]BBB27429.1 lipopolysaccharide export system permease protein [Amphritea japonica ATCC BAA-1530]